MALGFGFRCGFLGLLHMEIVQERLEREYDLDLIFTAPSVEYQVTRTDGSELASRQPGGAAAAERDRRDPRAVGRYLRSSARPLHRRRDGAGRPRRRGAFKRMEYLDSTGDDGEEGRGARVVLEYHVPLAEILVDYYDQLKSRTQGYASLDYTLRRLRARAARQARHPGQRPAGRRAVADHAPREGGDARPPARREAAQA